MEEEQEVDYRVLGGPINEVVIEEPKTVKEFMRTHVHRWAWAEDVYGRAHVQCYECGEVPKNA